MATTTVTASAPQLAHGIGAARSNNRARQATVSHRDESHWRRRAACRETPTATFFPAGGSHAMRGDEERAKAVCSACPVRASCLGFAVEHGEAEGVWGGLNAEERRALLVARPENGQPAE